MKKILFLFLFLIPMLVFSQKDTTYIFGVNGRMGEITNPKSRKEIKYNKPNKLVVITSIKKENEWRELFSEKIKIQNDSTFTIKIKSDEFSGVVIRKFEKQENGIFKFTDWLDERIKRTGHSLKKVPLILVGKVTDFYTNGKIKSVSEYKDNELVTNTNWLPNGEKNVDDIFYSVDSEPLFNDGIGRLHQHILRTFKDYKIDLEGVQGNLLVGFVVTTDGKIQGIRVVKGIAPQINTVAVKAFETSLGTWTPAKIDGKDVNYFQLFPINILHKDYKFDSIEMDGRMMYWEIN